VEKNKKTREEQEAYDGMVGNEQMAGDTRQSSSHFISKIIDIREYDVAYHVRCMVDYEIRCSFWYDVSLDGQILKKLTHLPEKLDKAPLRIFAFDIETTKMQLKFPDSKFD
jgi:DNA polymerase epsilon subunit 1